MNMSLEVAGEIRREALRNMRPGDTESIMRYAEANAVTEHMQKNFTDYTLDELASTADAFAEYYCQNNAGYSSLDRQAFRGFWYHQMCNLRGGR